MYIQFRNDGSIKRQVIKKDSEDENYIYVDEEFIDDSVYYVNVSTKEILPKQDYTLKNLPLPCTITIEGISYEVTEQPTFEFDVAGEYVIEVDAGVEYLKKEFKYVVEA